MEKRIEKPTESVEYTRIMAERKQFSDKQFNDIMEQIEKVRMINCNGKPELQIDVLNAMVAGYQWVTKLFLG